MSEQKSSQEVLRGCPQGRSREDVHRGGREWMSTGEIARGCPQGRSREEVASGGPLKRLREEVSRERSWKEAGKEVVTGGLMGVPTRGKLWKTRLRGEAARKGPNRSHERRSAGRSRKVKFCEKKF